MIKTIEKDLTTITSGVIGHQVNCRGAMGAGIAKTIADLYPNLLIEYKKLCSEDTLQPSTCFIWKQDGLTILNLAGQLMPGGPSPFESPNTRLVFLTNAIRDAIDKLPPNPTIYLPYKIGCGIAGGNWDLTLHMLENLEDVNIILCKLPMTTSC